MAMPALTEPYANPADDYTTFAALAERARVRRAVHRGPHRPAVAGAHVRQVGRRTGFRGADVRRVLAAGRLRLPTEDGLTLLADFRADPQAHRLGTPSGRIEIFSDDIDGFGYDDCAGHPTWFEPTEWLGGAARGATIRCICWPTSPRRGYTASWTAARPARPRKCKGANRSGCTRRRAAARTGRRRRGAGVQRPRRLPGGRGGRRPAAPRGRATVDRRVVRPGRPLRSRRDVRARQPQRADRRRRHLVAGAAAAPVRMCWSRWRSSPGRCRRCAPMSRR